MVSSVCVKGATIGEDFNRFHTRNNVGHSFFIIVNCLQFIIGEGTLGGLAVILFLLTVSVSCWTTRVTEAVRV